MTPDNFTIDTDLLVDYAHGLLRPPRAALVKQALEKDEFLRGQYEGILHVMKTHPDKDPGEIADKMVLEIDTRVDKAIKIKKKGDPSVSPLQPVTAQSDVNVERIVPDLPKHQPFVLPWRRIAAAASVVLIIGLTYFFTAGRKTDPVMLAGELLKKTYYDSALVSITERGEEDSSWLTDFKRGNYRLFIQKMAAIPDSNRDAQKNLYYGLACLKDQPPQIELAETQLQRVAESEGNYQRDAWYYLAITHLLKKDIQTAKKYLYKANNEQAKELLSRLPD